MLSIRYIPDTHMAKLSMRAYSPAWGEIRRVCLENSKDVYVESGVSLQIPWWAFLNCKDALRLTFRKYKVKVDLDPEAGKLIEDSLKKKCRLQKCIKC